jgi:hypothetical protein
MIYGLRLKALRSLLVLLSFAAAQCVSFPRE